MCICVNMLWMVFSCMRQTRVRCGFVNSVWRFPRVPSLGVLLVRQKGN